MILDTNALSALADGDDDLEPLLQKIKELWVPVIVLGEYRYGIRLSRSRARYERWLEDMIDACHVLTIDGETAKEYAGVRDELKRKGRPIPANDLWIAALARQHALPLLSRDRHFDFVRGLRRLGW